MPGKKHCLVIKNTAAHPTAQTVGPNAIPSGSGYGPSQLRSAYNLAAAAAADGSGTTVAVVDAYNDPTAASDLAEYRSAAGLPALTRASSPCTTRRARPRRCLRGPGQ